MSFWAGILSFCGGGRDGDSDRENESLLEKKRARIEEFSGKGITASKEFLTYSRNLPLSEKVTNVKKSAIRKYSTIAIEPYDWFSAKWTPFKSTTFLEESDRAKPGKYQYVEVDGFISIRCLWRNPSGDAEFGVNFQPNQVFFGSRGRRHQKDDGKRRRQKEGKNGERRGSLGGEAPRPTHVYNAVDMHRSFPVHRIIRPGHLKDPRRPATIQWLDGQLITNQLSQIPNWAYNDQCFQQAENRPAGVGGYYFQSGWDMLRFLLWFQDSVFEGAARFLMDPSKNVPYAVSFVLFELADLELKDMHLDQWTLPRTQQNIVEVLSAPADQGALSDQPMRATTRLYDH